MKCMIIPVITAATGMVTKTGKIGSRARNTFNGFTITVILVSYGEYCGLKLEATLAGKAVGSREVPRRKDL
jgi:hypothetical protein